MTKVRAWAAAAAGEKFKPYEYEQGPLADDDVDIDVEYCGLCHSDYSIWKNDWGVSEYPFVGGHEVVGRVRAVGAGVKNIKPGDNVGLGWMARSDLTTKQCLAGDHHLSPGNEQTIVARHGGFADIVRCQQPWAIKLPDGLKAEDTGPLFCGGITVFNPLLAFNVRPTDRVGVVGIGGLGHMALQFLNKWGCEVTAFTSSADKQAEAKKFGAHNTLNSRDPKSWNAMLGHFDFIIVTVNVTLDWAQLLATLAPKGRLHFVGAVPEPIEFQAFNLIGAQKQISGSPVGSPGVIAEMLDFCARHAIAPQTELFAMSEINKAMEHLESGKARYRIVLKNDF